MARAPLLKSLAGKLTTGAGPVAVTVILSNVLRIFSSLILTRLLTSSDYGVVGVSMAVFGVINLVSDLGFVAFVVRSKEGLDSRLLDEIWTLRLIRSVVLTGLMAAVSVPLSILLGNQDLWPVMAAMGVTFFLEGLSSMGFATCVREGRLVRVGIVDVLTQVCQMIFTIILAFVFRNYWAFVVGSLLGWVMRAIFSYTIFPDARRRFAFSRERSAELWRFSRFIAGSSTITAILGQSDKLVLTRLMPLQTFGLYVVASTLAQAPSQLSTPLGSRVFYPRFARIMREEPERFARLYYSTRSRLTLLYMFATGGFAACAPLVIKVMYDPRYLGAGIFLQVLALAAIPTLNNEAANAAMLAQGRMWNTLIANVVRIGWLAVGGTVGFLAFGVFGVVVALGLMQWAALVYCWYVLQRAGLLSVRMEALFLAAAAAGGAIGFGVSEAGLALLG